MVFTLRAVMATPRSAAEIRRVNTRYHDVAAAHYDRKWGIDFGPVGRAQVTAKLAKALGAERPGHFARALEIGAGTGYFSLNLLRAGTIGEATCTDISPGMLDTLLANAHGLGLDVRTAACDATRLPFAAESFDLVLGHAVLHHLPNLHAALSEFRRVLRPGGVIAFAGEPSRHGDRISSVPKRGAARLAPAWRALLRAGPAPANCHAPHEAADHDLEDMVDVHAFTPETLTGQAEAAGFTDVRLRGEELLANWFGWTNRTLEATADPEQIPWLWTRYAYRGYLLLQRVDRRLLEGRLPAGVFYNLLLSARRPA